MRRNLLKALRIQSREDVISDLVCFLINNSKKFARAFLKGVCRYDYEGDSPVSAITRKMTRSTGVPDLVVVVETEGRADLIIIENKIKAKEGKGQTEKYAKAECQNDLKRIAREYLHRDISWRNTKLILWTLFPLEGPEAIEFKKSTYENLIDVLKLETFDNDQVGEMVCDFVKTYSEFYRCGEVDDGDDLLSRLAGHKDLDLDEGYLVFKRVFESIACPNDLAVDNIYRAGQAGRKYYGCPINKSSWHPDELYLDKTYREEEYASMFDIHFEPQWDVLNSEMIIRLHYQTNPNVSKQQAEDDYRMKGYEKYNERRQKFINAFRDRSLVGVNVRVGSNQVARIEFPLLKSNPTVGEFRKEFPKLLLPIAEAIDEILEEMNADTGK